MKRFIFLLFLCFLLQNLLGFDEGEDKNKTVAFVQPEFSIGKAVPSNSNFPKTNYQTNFALSIGKMVFNPAKAWAVYLNYPTTGITFSYTNLGSKDVFGSAFTIVPYITFNTSKKPFNTVQIKLGLGTSYFTNHYDASKNTRNLAIGSTFTWTFQTSFYYNFYIHKNIDLNLGIQFIHHSNGHTQLPNLGLNSVLFSLSSKLFLDPVDKSYKEKYQKPRLNFSRQYFVNMRIGMGFHEFGGPGTITGDTKRSVNIVSLGIGAIYKQVLKVRLGLSYRFYHHYYRYIIEYQPQSFNNPVLNASNIQVYIGGELLLGHVGIDAEIALNIYKPFYAIHHELYEDDEGLSYWLKKTISTRLGLKFYLYNTAKNPKNNIFIGTHINANMGQADFSEICVGVVHRLNNAGKQH